MPNRREVLGMLAASGTAPLGGCGGGMEAYTEAATRLRAALPADPGMRDFIRYATLAANGHNTQPWRFAPDDNGVTILPDPAGRTPAVDPDDHHLFVSLGCAAENFLIAAAAHGRPGAAAFSDADGDQIRIDLATGLAAADPLYDAIPVRQSTRSVYDGRSVPAGDLRRLAAAAAADGVSLLLITEPARRDAVRDYVIAGNSTQMDDPAFVRELKDSIRFNEAEALRTRDGLFAACSGNPTLPGWIGRPAFGLFFRKGPENDKYAAQMASSAGVAVFVGDRADKGHWVRVGRSFQRFALQATALGIAMAHVNQPVEVPAVRTDFASWLGTDGKRADLVVRFGYAPPLQMSLRRPVDAVIAGSRT